MDPVSERVSPREEFKIASRCAHGAEGVAGGAEGAVDLLVGIVAGGVAGLDLVDGVLALEVALVVLGDADAVGGMVPGGGGGAERGLAGGEGEEERGG